MEAEPIDLTKSEIDLLAKLVWHEAQGDTYEGQKAVAQVVVNRMYHSAFPDTIEGVIYQRGQFSGVHRLSRAAPTEQIYEAVHEVLSGDYILPETVVYFWTNHVPGRGGWFRWKHENHFYGEVGEHYFYHFKE